MPRLPLRSSRRLRHQIPPRSTNVAPPPPPEPILILDSPPPSLDHAPMSWLEMALTGYSASFVFEVNNERVMVHLDNPVYLARIVSEGIHLAINTYEFYIDSGMVIYPSNPNLPHNLAELPFYHPQQPGVDILYLSNQSHHSFTMIQVPTSDPYAPPPSHQPAPPNNGEQIEEEDTTPLPSMALQQGIRPKVYVLNSMKSFIIEGGYIKQCILKCPVRLSKCTMDIRVITNPNSKKFGVFLVPTLVPMNDDDDEEPPKMTLMIWNCRGSEQSDFRKSYRSMLDYHRPTMVLLLETHMSEHQHLADEFSFTNLANVPAMGGCGGMALVWRNDSIAVGGLAINSEEIHYTIQIVNPPAAE